MRYLQLFLIILLSLSIFSPAFAQNNANEPDKYVKIRLLAEKGDVKAGDTIWIGVEQSIYPDWHTYWINPGDSGSATRIKWSTPDGLQVGAIHWPTPEKIPYGPLTNYGYAENVILLQQLMLPDDLPKGPIEIMADIEVLVCNDICIPEFGTYTLTLNDPGNPGEDNSAYLSEAVKALPETVAWTSEFYEENGDFVLAVMPGKPFFDKNYAGAAFFPYEWGLVDNAAEAEFEVTPEKLVMRQTRGERPLNEIQRTAGLLTFTDKDDKVHAVSIVAETGNASNIITPSMTIDASSIALWQALLLALLGGLVLNLMPCVFPVLSIKALSLVKQADKDKNHTRALGLAYTAGIILSFLAVASVLIALKAAGQSIGWGFQLQNPVVVALLGYLLFIVGLNLMGLFEIAGHFGNFGNKLTQGNGLTSAFFAGVLATIVATPCTAPFMAAALGYALVQPTMIALIVFAALGLGLALPYLALSFIPALRHILPKPGAWMETFRQFLAFPMFASSAWLVWVLAQQTGTMGVLGILLGMVAIAFGFWLLSHKPAKPGARIAVLILAAASFLLALGFLPSSEAASDQPALEQLSMGEPYTPDMLANLLLSDDPIFVEMTAAWCITCKLNHAVAINTAKTKTLFAQKNVHYLVGDWTNYDAEITDYLNSFGRNGVPLYNYYGPRDIVTGERPEAITLPQLLTPGIVAETVGRF